MNPLNSTNILLFGYNGANNTGSEARLLTIIDDVRAVFGPEAKITIPTLNEENLRRYIQESETLKIAPLPSIFFAVIQRLVKESDFVVLTEGSCYMDTWTSALLWAFLWATRCARAMGKPCIAYAVDAGSLSGFNRWLVRREASKTNLIVTRNNASSDLLKSLGVTAPIKVTADTAFYFDPDPADRDSISKTLPTNNGIIGLAPVDFYRWPVVIRLTGNEEDCYRWPYYYSTSRQRTESSEALARGLASEADRWIGEYGKHVALIAMESLDTPICYKIRSHMAHPEMAQVFSAIDYNASQMTTVLRSLELLVTSRYHASVLSMRANVPLIAVAHDLRLHHLFEEAGLFNDYFLEYTDPELFQKVRKRVDALLADPGPAKTLIAKSYREQLARATNNRALLSEIASSNGLTVLK